MNNQNNYECHLIYSQGNDRPPLGGYDDCMDSSPFCSHLGGGGCSEFMNIGNNCGTSIFGISPLPKLAYL